MAEEKQWQRDAFAFTNDLYFFMFSKRKMDSSLPASIKSYSENSPYTEFVGKAILYLWHIFRDCHRFIICNTYPEIAESGIQFFQYLHSVCPGAEELEGENIFLIVADMSAKLFEICCYLLEKNHTSFLHMIQTGWSSVFRRYYKERFFASGGWKKLRLECINCGIQFEKTEMLFPKGYLFTRKDVESVFEFTYPSTATDLIREGRLRLPRPGILGEIKSILSQNLDGKESYEGQVPDCLESTHSSEAIECCCGNFERVPKLHHGTDLSNTFSKGNEDVEDARRKTCSPRKSTERMHNQYKETKQQLHHGTELDNLHEAGSEVIGGARRKTFRIQNIKKETSKQNEDKERSLHPGLEKNVLDSGIRESINSLLTECRDRSLTATSETSTGEQMDSPTKISRDLATGCVLPLGATPLHD